TSTTGGNTFTVSGWTGSGSLTGSSDIVAATKGANFTLTNTALSAGAMVLSLSGITTANVTDTSGGHTFTVSGWTGSGSLTGTAGAAETVTATKSANFTLTNSALASSDGMA